MIGLTAARRRDALTTAGQLDTTMTGSIDGVTATGTGIGRGTGMVRGTDIERGIEVEIGKGRGIEMETEIGTGTGESETEIGIVRMEGMRGITVTGSLSGI